jgi:hypothetical protein
MALLYLLTAVQGKERQEEQDEREQEVHPPKRVRAARQVGAR